MHTRIGSRGRGWRVMMTTHHDQVHFITEHRGLTRDGFYCMRRIWRWSSRSGWERICVNWMWNLRESIWIKNYWKKWMKQRCLRTTFLSLFPAPLPFNGWRNAEQGDATRKIFTTTTITKKQTLSNTERNTYKHFDSSREECVSGWFYLTTKKSAIGNVGASRSHATRLKVDDWQHPKILASHGWPRWLGR